MDLHWEMFMTVYEEMRCKLGISNVVIFAVIDIFTFITLNKLLACSIFNLFMCPCYTFFFFFFFIALALALFTCNAIYMHDALFLLFQTTIACPDLDIFSIREHTIILFLALIIYFLYVTWNLNIYTC